MSAAADAPGAPASVPAATLAHQLGEAVALLDGYVAVLSGSAGLAPPERHAVEMIALATARLRRCTQDLIELAAAGRERPDDAPADAGRALADAVEAVRR
ncbi:MAG TPA: hypothetical protein VFT42_04155, partial [Solirubrobacteraceae bacterium]|nr:hypothetical protein [Solirubrobacteraceae bacterium]